MLIELCLGEPFQKLRVSRMLNSDTMSDFGAATQLLDMVGDEYGDQYADVVSRCIRCEFNTRSRDLADKQFCKAVYEGVVVPLEKDLKKYPRFMVV